MSFIKKIKILNDKEIQLEEDAHIGDIIDISKIDEKQVDLNYISKAINSGKDVALEKFKVNIAENAELHAKAEMQEKINELEKKAQEANTKLQILEQTKKSDIEKTKAEVQSSMREEIIAEQRKAEAMQHRVNSLQNEIEYQKNLKLASSTKLIGETLEAHCMSLWQSQGQYEFPNATFEKDNDINNSQKQKGDFIYRENDVNGQEILSIMFEMKNESDATQQKNKNSDFYSKLDSDRNTKRCEFAVLVSMLEKDNAAFNGIHAVPEKTYKDMYVVRPENFISIIRLLRAGIIKNLKSMNEIALLKGQNVEITAFENNLEEFKNDFDYNKRLAGQHFDKAVEELKKSRDKIDATIMELEKWQSNFGKANTKLQKLSMKKLVKDSPTLAAEYEKNKNK